MSRRRMLKDVASPSKRRHTQAGHASRIKADMEASEAKTRAAYLARPDTAEDADDWSNAQRFMPFREYENG